MKTVIKKDVLSRILKEKFYHDRPKKECNHLADLFLADDFPKNNITNYAQAFRFLGYIQELRISTGYKRI